MKLKHFSLGLTLLVSAAVAPSCHIAAAVGLGVAISQEFSENAHSLRMSANYEQTWEATRQTLQTLSLDPIKIDGEKGLLEAHVQGTRITCQVSAHDSSETVLAVTAKSFGRYENDTAQDFLFRVRKRLDQQ